MNVLIFGVAYLGRVGVLVYTKWEWEFPTPRGVWNGRVFSFFFFGFLSVVSLFGAHPVRTYSTRTQNVSTHTDYEEFNFFVLHFHPGAYGTRKGKCQFEVSYCTDLFGTKVRCGFYRNIERFRAALTDNFPKKRVKFNSFVRIC